MMYVHTRYAWKHFRFSWLLKNCFRNVLLLLLLMYVYACTCATVGSYSSPFSPLTMWVLQIELRLPGLAAGTFIHWAVLLALPCFFSLSFIFWIGDLFMWFKLQNFKDLKDTQGSFPYPFGPQATLIPINKTISATHFFFYSPKYIMIKPKCIM